jgi:hypothetical protein
MNMPVFENVGVHGTARMSGLRNYRAFRRPLNALAALQFTAFATVPEGDENITLCSCSNSRRVHALDVYLSPDWASPGHSRVSVMQE